MKSIVLQRTVKSVIFLLIFLLILVGLSNLFIPRDNNEVGKYMDAEAVGVLAEAEDTVDVVFLGSSESYTSYNPLQIFAEYGISSYDVGTAGQRIIYSYELLEDVLTCQHPKVVVMDAHSIIHKMPKHDILSYMIQDKLQIFRYHGRWKTVSLSDVNKDVQYTNRVWSKGFVGKAEIVPADTTNYMAPDDSLENPDIFARYYFNQIRKCCEKNDIQLVIASTPSTINWSYAKHNAVEQLADKYGLTYIDMNTLTTEVPIDWAVDSSDGGDHLNVTGAAKVTSFMGQYLSSLGTLTDHRGDPEYASWQQ